MTRLISALSALVLLLAIAGCSDDDKEPSADPSESGSSSAAEDDKPAVPITNAQGGQVKADMPRERVEELLGEPLLTQEPYGDFPGGCVYYAMENTSLANVWQFCFDEQGVVQLLTALSPTQPAAPEGASDARAALIARADAICQRQDGFLGDITNDITASLTKYSDKADETNLNALLRDIGRFIANIEQTHDELSAFTPPADNQDAYTAYVDALAAQAAALTEGKDALAEGDLAAYDEHGVEFNDYGQEAITAAEQYGFSFCSASDWA